jgi:hypothetical protein
MDGFETALTAVFRTLSDIVDAVNQFNERPQFERFVENSKKEDKFIDSLRSKLDEAIKLFGVSVQGCDFWMIWLILLLHTGEYSSSDSGEY